MKLDTKEVYYSEERTFLVAYKVRYKATNNKEKKVIPVIAYNSAKAQKQAREIVNQDEDIKSAMQLYVEDLANGEITY